MKPVTQHITINVAVKGQHSIFSETFKFVFFQSQKGKSYTICHERKGKAQILAPQYHQISYPTTFFLSAFIVGRTQSCKSSAIWSTASLLVRHSMTGFVGTGQEDEPPRSLDLTTAKFPL